jgi:hypothetical protein
LGTCVFLSATKSVEKDGYKPKNTLLKQIPVSQIPEWRLLAEYLQSYSSPFFLLHNQKQ